MSRKKKSGKTFEKKNEWLNDELREEIDELMEDAWVFLDDSNPFDISVALAEIGVITSHRAGIEQFLEQSLQSLSKDLEPRNTYEELLKVLSGHWLMEAKSKGKQLAMRDLIFLTQAAHYFNRQWGRSIQRNPEHPGLTRLPPEVVWSVKKPISRMVP